MLPHINRRNTVQSNRQINLMWHKFSTFLKKKIQKKAASSFDEYIFIDSGGWRPQKLGDVGQCCGVGQVMPVSEGNPTASNCQTWCMGELFQIWGLLRWIFQPDDKLRHALALTFFLSLSRTENLTYCLHLHFQGSYSSKTWHCETLRKLFYLRMFFIPSWSYKYKVNKSTNK